MQKFSKIIIEPFEHYTRFKTNKHILVNICFEFGEGCTFGSEFNKKGIRQLMSDIDAFLDGKTKSDTVLEYPDVTVFGDCEMHPFSFEIKPSEGVWIFRYKSYSYGESFDFLYKMNENEIRLMRYQLERQYKDIDWNSLGKCELYTFDFPERDFEWCYSAKALRDSLCKVCLGKQINSLYVSVGNYAGPLTAGENYVYYYLGSGVIVELDDILLHFLIHASGLFQWRVFKKCEYSINGPKIDLASNFDEEFCKIGNAYDCFKLEYRGSRIERISVRDTDSAPFYIGGFDEARAENPNTELPEGILLGLENGNTLSLFGEEDYFGIDINK